MEPFVSPSARQMSADTISVNDTRLDNQKMLGGSALLSTHAAHQYLLSKRAVRLGYSASGSNATFITTPTFPVE